MPVFFVPLKLRILSVPAELYPADRAVTVLCNDDLGFADRIVHIIVITTVKKHNAVRVLLDSTGVA